MTTSTAITVATVKQSARVITTIGRWVVLSVNGSLVATDGEIIVQTTRRGRTAPVYSVLEECRLYPVRDIDGFTFVSIPK